MTGVLATGVAGIARFILADTGNGSWLDFGIDAVACMTFGLSRVAGISAKVIASTAEGASKSASVTELAEGTGESAAMLARFADMTGRDVGDLAEKFSTQLAKTAVKTAEADGELTGAWRVFAKLAMLSTEETNFRNALAITSRFSATMEQLNITAKGMLAFSGISTGIAASTGVASLVGGGIEFDGPNGPSPINWHIPGVYQWYTTNLEVPTGG